MRKNIWVALGRRAGKFRPSQNTETIRSLNIDEHFALRPSPWPDFKKIQNSSEEKQNAIKKT